MYVYNTFLELWPISGLCIMGHFSESYQLDFFNRYWRATSFHRVPFLTGALLRHFSSVILC